VVLVSRLLVIFLSFFLFFFFFPSVCVCVCVYKEPNVDFTVFEQTKKKKKLNPSGILAKPNGSEVVAGL